MLNGLREMGVRHSKVLQNMEDLISYNFFLIMATGPGQEWRCQEAADLAERQGHHVFARDLRRRSSKSVKSSISEGV